MDSILLILGDTLLESQKHIPETYDISSISLLNKQSSVLIIPFFAL